MIAIDVSTPSHAATALAAVLDGRPDDAVTALRALYAGELTELDDACGQLSRLACQVRAEQWGRTDVPEQQARGRTVVVAFDTTPPVPTTCFRLVADADDMAVRLRAHLPRRMGTHDVAVTLDWPARTGTITVGGRPAGSFTITGG